MTASAFSQITIGGGGAGQLIAPATQVVDASRNQDVLVFNTSTSVTVYLTENNYSVSTDAGTTAVTPLGPQQSVVFNGELDVFAVCPVGMSAVLNLFPSATNFTQNIGVTNLLSIGSATGAGGQVVGPTSVATLLTLADITLYQSYDLALFVGCPNQANAGSALTSQVILTWYDDLASGIAVFTEVWNVWVLNTINPATVGGVPNIVGCGPMHGRYLTVTIQNTGNSNIEVCYLQLFGSPRPLPLSDWRQDMGGLISDHTVPVPAGLFPALAFDNNIADTGVLSFPSAGLNWLPMNLYSGPVHWLFQVAGAGTTFLSAEIVDVGVFPQLQTSGNLNPSDGKVTAILPAAGSTGGTYEGDCFLPRSACALFFNVSVVGSGEYYFKCVAQQGP